MKKLFNRGVLLALVIMVLSASSVLAVTFTGIITVTNNTTTVYPNLPITVSANISYLVANNFISSSGNDTNVMSGSNVMQSMLASDRILFTDNVSANGNQQYNFVTGQTPKSIFPIITGYNGYVTANDTSSLESGNVWRDVFNGYFDATKNGYFENKLAAKVLKGDGSGNITARIYNTENFTTYTAVNAGSLTITAPSIVALNTPGNGTTYVYKDYGANHFNFLDATFSVNITDQPVNPFGEAGIGFANVVGNTNNFTNSDVWTIFQPRGGGVVWAKLGRGDPETSGNVSTSMVLSSGVQYFCNITRDANSDTVGLGIFSDSSLTTLVASLSLTGFGTTQWRYSYGFANDNSGLVRPFSGTISDFNFPALMQSLSSVPSGLTTVAFNSDGVNLWITANSLSSANVTTVSVHDSPFPNKFILSNNIMPYANNITFSVNGTEKLRYQPNTIVNHSQLTDLDGTMNGDITWGSNPSGVSASMGSLNPSQQQGLSGATTTSQDIAPKVKTNYGEYRPNNPAPVNPLSPFINLIATGNITGAVNTGSANGADFFNIPPLVIWLLISLLASFGVYALVVWLTKMFWLAGIVGGGCMGWFVVIHVVPWWMLAFSLILVVMGILHRDR